MSDNITPANDNKGMPLVSIVMCTYNGEQFIREQLESLCKQTYPSLEIIICDDRSTDGSYAILEEFAAIDPRIRLCKNEVNLGYTRNFSHACSLAKGDYISISDQDDVWHPDKVKRIMESWVPGTPLMYCNSRRFYDDIVPWGIKPLRLYRHFQGKDSRKLAIYNTVSGHALIAKREFLQSLLPFPEGIFYDWWAAGVAACHGGVGFLNEILVFQRVHGQNISIVTDHSAANRKKNKDTSNEMVGKHIAAFATIEGMPPKHKQFYQTLNVLWQQAMTKKFSRELFLFLVRYRDVIFWYKKRKVAVISQIKHSYILSKNYL